MNLVKSPELEYLQNVLGIETILFDGKESYRGQSLRVFVFGDIDHEAQVLFDRMIQALRSHLGPDVQILSQVVHDIKEANECDGPALLLAQNPDVVKDRLESFTLEKVRVAHHPNVLLLDASKKKVTWEEMQKTKGFFEII